jgi:uncharacterized protein (DUF924 family)
MDVRVLDDIHRYWFGDPPEVPPSEELIQRWFRPSEEVDAHIRETWGWYLDEARATDWNLSALGREQQVGLVILLDQFPRQIFRTSGEAFAYDETARSIVRPLVADGGWRRFAVYEQTFILLPLEHSEDLADQDLSVMCFAACAVEAPEAAKERVRSTLDYATKHRDIIRRFGRFPHRNEALGRASTEEEAKFLAEHGRGF